MARSLKRRILDSATAHYLSSGEFNGLPVRDILTEYHVDQLQVFRAINALVRDRTACLIFGDRHPNPHIKAFPEETTEAQIAKLRQWRNTDKDAEPFEVIDIPGKQIVFIEDNLSPCLYPTAAHL